MTVDVRAVFAEASGFLRTLAPEVVSSSRETAVLRLDAGPELHNHLGGPHAAALFGLGELTAFALLLEVFGDLVESGAVPFIKSADISFTSVVTEPVLAQARLVDDEAAVRARFTERGSASFDVEVLFRRETDGTPTTTMRPRMALKQM